MSEFDLDELRDELAEFAAPTKTGGRTPKEERIIAGFEDIQRFFEEHGRAPRHGEDNDIFERLYAVRLDRLRSLEDCRTLLTPMDHQGLLSGELDQFTASAEEMDDDALLAELEGAAGSQDITKLKHVRTSAEKREADEIAKREQCKDFDVFQPLFQKVKADLESGIRTTRPFVKDAGFLKADIQAGQFFILGGQTAYVATVGDQIKAPNGETDARLRVIYSNGTESDLLLRSLQRALYKDEGGRRITEPSAGPLFDDFVEGDDLESGTIYVLRTLSDDPLLADKRQLLHKIGVTGGDVSRRIAGARFDPTFLMADVEIVASYRLYNISRTKMEALIHKIFGAARLDVGIPDRMGQKITPREWFLVPLHIIDQVIDMIKDGTIVDVVYDPQTASLV